jgi:hypothetical protein
MREEIDPVQGTVDSKRTAEPPGPATEVTSDRRAAPSLHEIETFDRLERAHQHACTFTVALAR